MHCFCCFRVKSTDEVGAEVYTEMLLKNTTPYITTQVKMENLYMIIITQHDDTGACHKCGRFCLRQACADFLFSRSREGLLAICG